MWSLALARVGRTGGAEKFSSPTTKYFFDSIGHFRSLQCTAANGQYAFDSGKNGHFGSGRQRTANSFRDRHTAGAVSSAPASPDPVHEAQSPA